LKKDKREDIVVMKRKKSPKKSRKVEKPTSLIPGLKTGKEELI
jgi:hypothetical protein